METPLGTSTIEVQTKDLAGKDGGRFADDYYSQGPSDACRGVPVFLSLPWSGRRHVSIGSKVRAPSHARFGIPDSTVATERRESPNSGKLVPPQN